MKVNVGSYIVQYSVPCTAQTMRVIAYEGKCRFLYSAVFSPLHCSNNEGDSMHVKAVSRCNGVKVLRYFTFLYFYL